MIVSNPTDVVHSLAFDWILLIGHLCYAYLFDLSIGSNHNYVRSMIWDFRVGYTDFFTSCNTALSLGVRKIKMSFIATVLEFYD